MEALEEGCLVRVSGGETTEPKGYNYSETDGPT